MLTETLQLANFGSTPSPDLIRHDNVIELNIVENLVNDLVMDVEEISQEVIYEDMGPILEEEQMLQNDPEEYDEDEMMEDGAELNEEQIDDEQLNEQEIMEEMNIEAIPFSQRKHLRMRNKVMMTTQLPNVDE